MREAVCDMASISLIGDRADNQDRLGWFRQGSHYLLALADGMGGHAAGDRAAQCLVDAAADGFTRTEADAAGAHLTAILDNAHRRARRLASGYPGQPPPATTAVLCRIDDDIACWAHVGDSRLYHIRAGGVIRTRDHSPLEDLLQRGALAEHEARRHPLRNQVGRCVGGYETRVALTVARPVRLAPGDIVLLCSDGFWEAFGQEELAGTLSAAGEHEDALRDTLASLANQAVARGRPRADNATALALRVPYRSL